MVRVRRIDGAVVGNRAQLTVIRNQGAKNGTVETFVVKLSHDRAAVRIPLPDGRRHELDPDRATANAKTGQLQRVLQVLIGYSPRPRHLPWQRVPAALAPGAVVPAVAGQAAFPPAIAGPAGIPPVANISNVTQAALSGAGGLAVGYQPVVEWIPQGVTMTAAAVVSNDLRYVRLAVTPSITTITEVFTFTFVGQ